ncbi:hypothetical protein [Sphingobium sp. CAP-1]|uniref:hypothetical protein n=1 Tax=Sphingobium sp. CAP-1 TaxID=2676077 RepID=UPI0012BB2C04|nr:hypothetical protein [Sphingobium sp. CAP-1]QGP80678.1 hypothetical protein GL174_16380 [Sphingobium sp. CAP-1]
MRSYCALALAVTLAACASTPAPNYTPTRVPISFPKLNEETKVSLGEDMLRQGFYTEEDGIELRQENNIKGYRISAGFYPQIAEDKENTYHSFRLQSNREGAGYIPQARDFLGLPLPFPQSVRASKTKQETCIITGGLNGPICDTEHDFKRTRQPVLSERDLQQTLIYSGRVGDRIRIGYRESSGNMARPAFSNEAEYDLSTSSEIAYRGARIKVLEADNQKIRYIVLSNFNTN